MDVDFIMKKLFFILLIVLGRQSAYAMQGDNIFAMASQPPSPDRFSFVPAACSSNASDGDSEFWNAMKENNVEKVAELLQKDPYAGQIGCPPGSTPFRWAVNKSKCPEIVELFLKNLKEIDYDLLYGAVEENQPAIVSLLLKYGANPNSLVGGYLPLNKAAESGFDDILLILINHGANVNSKDRAGWTPLHDATDHGHLKTALLLLERGADWGLRTNESTGRIFQRNKCGKTPIELARSAGYKDVARLLEEWPKKRAAMRLALLMATHPRVGASSGLSLFNNDLLRRIAKYLIP